MGTVDDRSAVSVKCRHHWMLPPSNGPTVRGVCKFCGEKDAWPASSYGETSYNKVKGKWEQRDAGKPEGYEGVMR